MAYNLKQEVAKPERFSGGHRLCAGCGASIAVRGVLRALNVEDKAVIGCATGCLEVSSFLYPYTAWHDSFIHCAFENAAATISGVEACYKVKKKRGLVKDTYKFIAIGGDGGTYDIGIQALSGAMERNHDMVYVCYNNEAYMNTGIQRSSATTRHAETTTSAIGSAIQGKEQNNKDLTNIMAAHHIPYAAQTTFFGTLRDLHEKAEKALYTPGAAFLNILAPCPRGWRYHAEDIGEICRLAMDTCIWPVYEVEHDVWKINYEPKEKKPIEDFLRPQGRFRHLFHKGNEALIADIQKEVDHRWELLKKRAG